MQGPKVAPRTPAIERMAAVREVARLRRLARAQRHLWFFYLEHNLFEAAREARLDLLDSLRRACRQWQLILAVSL